MHFMWAAVIGFMVGAIFNRVRPGVGRRHMLAVAGIGVGSAVTAAVIGRGLGFRAPGGHPGLGLYLSVGMMWTLIALSAFVVSRRPTGSATDR